jgi:hypothetical protein
MFVRVTVDGVHTTSLRRSRVGFVRVDIVMIKAFTMKFVIIVDMARHITSLVAPVRRRAIVGVF